MFSSRRQRGRTFTTQLEEHLPAEQTLDLGPRPRADRPDHSAALADQDRLSGTPSRRRRPRGLELPRSPPPRPRSRAEPPRASARAPARGRAPPIRTSSDRSVTSPVREVRGPSGRSRDERLAERLDALAGPRAHGMELLEVAERGGRLRSARRPGGRRTRSTLFSATTTGAPAAEHALGDEAVAGADRARRRRARTGPRPRPRGTSRPSAASARSARRAGAGSPAGRRGRAGNRRRSRRRDPPPVVCGLSETIATLPPQSAFTSVDLPTFGRPRRDEPAPHSMNDVGAGARRGRADERASPLVHEDAPGPTPNSSSHCRQPPQGEAVTASASTSPGPHSLDDRARERRPLGADAERVRRVLDVDAGDDAAVAREHGRADEELRVRRVRGLAAARACA